jgi:hypothetical protein
MRGAFLEGTQVAGAAIALIIWVTEHHFLTIRVISWSSFSVSSRQLFLIDPESGEASIWGVAQRPLSKGVPSAPCDKDVNGDGRTEARATKSALSASEWP